MDEITFSRAALSALCLRIPDGDIAADLGDGPATTVHLLPDEVHCEKVVFVANDHKMDKEGYSIDIGRLRGKDDWVLHLAMKKASEGHTPAIVQLAEAIAAKNPDA